MLTTQNYPMVALIQFPCIRTPITHLRVGELIPMTHVPETGVKNRLHFSAAVSGMCVMLHVMWHRIPFVPNFGADYNTVLFQLPREWNNDLWLVDDNCLCFNVFCCNLITKTTNSSSMSLSVTFIFGTKKLHSRRIYGSKNRRRNAVPENGVDLWRRFLERVS